MSDTLGKLLRQARVEKGINQKELAALVRREDHQPISPQYLNDIEHDRRTPTPEILAQLARLLGLNEDRLLVASGRMPEDIRKRALREPELAVQVFQAFRKKPR